MYPSMTTRRLTLRPPAVRDVERLVELLDDYDIARMTSRIPHPYRRQDALSWLSSLSADKERAYAAFLGAELIGVGGYVLRKDLATAEIGYWIGKPYWGRGLASEIASALVAHGFEDLHLDQITANHAFDNPASQRVIEKCGFERTGTRSMRAVSRGAEVEIWTYALTRGRASELGLMPS